MADRVTFRMGDVFPADDDIAVWVMNLSIALGDLRIVADYAVRDEQPDYERIYFVRLFASHLREVAKLLARDFDDRQDVRDFVAKLPQAGRDARDEAARMLNDNFTLRPRIVVWRDMARVRNDTFHYASDKPSRKRLRAAIEEVADMEGVYFVNDDGTMRADYADLVTANRMHPFEEQEPELPVTRELHDRIIALNEQVATFIAHAESQWLFSRSQGVVTVTSD
ncbi:hypothetical protein [Baekduia sp. Peel2402]|uniref:hypothetical protein n=1 Tax=Baekduia sp. Peel2402 TaxID=3458296 RepID=UPI00403EC9D4